MSSTLDGSARGPENKDVDIPGGFTVCCPGKSLRNARFANGRRTEDESSGDRSGRLQPAGQGVLASDVRPIAIEEQDPVWGQQLPQGPSPGEPAARAKSLGALGACTT